MTEREPLITRATGAYRFGRFLSWCHLKLWHRMRVEGKQHLPRTGSYLIVCNHQSFLDIPLVAAALMERHVCFVARESLARSKALGWLMRRSGAVLIRRGAADRAALKDMVEHLRAGDVVCVYPEGTRSQDGRLGPFLPGALFAARRAGVPVVPAGIRGAIEALPPHGRLPRPRRVAIRFGPPLDAGPDDAMDRAREAVAGMIGDGLYGTMRGS